jgi:hypothetical protein
MDSSTQSRASVSGVRTLVIVLALTVLALMALVALLAFTLNLGDPRQSANDSGYQNWAVIATFVVGTAAAVSVAWATVRLAQSAHDVSSEALRIARTQERREGLAFLDARAERLVESFSELSVALSNYIASALPIYLELIDADDGIVHRGRDAAERIEPYIRERHEAAVNAVGTLRSAVSLLSRDPISRRMCQDGLEQARPGSLRSTVQGLSDASRLDSGLASLVAADLPELQHTLAVREAEMTRLDVYELNRLQQIATYAGGDNAALSGLLFAGSLLWSVSLPPQSAADGEESDTSTVGASRTTHLSLGTTVLSDLRQMLPDADAIADAIASGYPDFAREVDVGPRLPTGHLFSLGASLEESFEAYNAESWRANVWHG